MLLLLLVFSEAFQLQMTAETTESRVLEHYSIALSDASLPELSEISTDLTPLRLDNADLYFDSEERVLLVFPGLLEDFPEEPSEITLYLDTFMTAYPELEVACRGFEQLQVLQLLGMSPEAEVDGIIEVFVSLAGVFRACPDPQIGDCECELSVLLKGEDAGPGGVPWKCEVSSEEQEASRVVVDSAHFEWMCQRWEISYGNEDVYSNRPWTGLGYTYNWGSFNEVGLSEFVVPAFSQVQFVAKYEIDKYCN